MRVLPTHGEAASAGAPRSRLAEQIAEQVAEGADILEARRRAVARALGPTGIFAVIAALRGLLAGGVDLAGRCEAVADDDDEVAARSDGVGGGLGPVAGAFDPADAGAAGDWWRFFD